MTYEIEIELADVLGPTLDALEGEIEDTIDTLVHAVLRHREIIDIGKLLAERNAIAIIWDIAHVRDQRSDLTDEQAWEVLQECQRSWERLNDPMVETIRQVAENLFPNLWGKGALRATLERIKRQIEALPEDELTDPAAYGSVAVALDTVETLVDGARS